MNSNKNVSQEALVEELLVLLAEHEVELEAEATKHSGELATFYAGRNIEYVRVRTKIENALGRNGVVFWMKHQIE